MGCHRISSCPSCSISIFVIWLRDQNETSPSMQAIKAEKSRGGRECELRGGSKESPMWFREVGWVDKCMPYEALTSGRTKVHNPTFIHFTPYREIVKGRALWDEWPCLPGTSSKRSTRAVRKTVGIWASLQEVEYMGRESCCSCASLGEIPSGSVHRYGHLFRAKMILPWGGIATKVYQIYSWIDIYSISLL